MTMQPLRMGFDTLSSDYGSEIELVTPGGGSGWNSGPGPDSAH